eukprot:gb/GFBE01011040.1/.p1 GENE.gb/GFBE01011040.1/~~gb/GFBE01011040.1/.p1  ORF type:complete len:694 (+),score=180.19 gb/GFBE01011040.1/:1-2082(+)
MDEPEFPDDWLDDEECAAPAEEGAEDQVEDQTEVQEEPLEAQDEEEEIAVEEQEEVEAEEEEQAQLDDPLPDQAEEEEQLQLDDPLPDQAIAKDDWDDDGDMDDEELAALEQKAIARWQAASAQPPVAANGARLTSKAAGKGKGPAGKGQKGKSAGKGDSFKGSAAGKAGKAGKGGKGKGKDKGEKAAVKTGGPGSDVKITPRSEDWSAWYLDVIASADLIDEAPVRGCKILRPNGFAVWEGIQRLLDPKIKAMGVQNAYFPLLIPVSFLSKEASHVDGFAKECAVVTHHRLRNAPEGSDALVEVDPDSKLAEPYVVRPTSETVVWHMYGKWINSYRDLPLKMNQWVNVMRWELKTRPFLRSAEFLWQEGHTAHATKEEADAQSREVLDYYVWLAQDELCLPLVPGRKSNNERFAGADATYTIEALTQNGMAIQAGTSHFLGQNFAKAFDVKYLSEEQKQEYVWASSWGVSTRLIGAVIMVHSDDDGLVLPPALANIQVVIVPMFSKDAEKQAAIMDAASSLHSGLTAAGIRVHVDDRVGMKPGGKYYEWERRGVPMRLELGARDLESGAALGKLRTGGDKFPVPLGEGAVEEVSSALQRMKQILLDRSEALKQSLTFKINSRDDFDARIKEREPGMMLVPWGGDDDDEDRLKDETGVTLRCYPMEQDELPEGQVCPLTGKPSREWAIFAFSY